MLRKNGTAQPQGTDGYASRGSIASTARYILRNTLAAVAVLSFLVYFVSLPQAPALTVERTTAKSNESSGNNIIGGQPTRITWEAKVGNNEKVASVTLRFPAGSTIAQGANVKATVLDDMTRIETEQNPVLTGDYATIEFPKPVPSGLLLRIEVYNVALPSATGDYFIDASYVDSEGMRTDLLGAIPIKVIGITATESVISWLDQQEWVQNWNSVLFLRIFFNPQLIVAAIPGLFFGWLRSLGLVLVGFPLAIPIGLGISFLRMARGKGGAILRFISSIYVNVVRGTPLFLQMYIAFFGLPFLGINVDSYLLGILVLAMNSSAYLAEIFRAGIQSIHKGQFEASSSLGMNAIQTMFFVIIPQTVRRVIPTATSEFILLYKDTSLLAAVGVMEQMMFAKSMVANTGNMTPYIVAACYYLVVTLPLTKIIAVFEKKLAAAEGLTTAPEGKQKKKRASSLAKEDLSTGDCHE
ncbi:MAG: amino acid ABC transporter permease [Coriobacteriales bacterium]|jgi:polar amino acid transport system substrate-binding protein|nr:amino acid ABC transporter permease [Coriobacteriales bacterium]